MPVKYQQVDDCRIDVPYFTPGNYRATGFFPTAKGTLAIGPDVGTNNHLVPAKPFGAKTVINAAGTVRRVIGTATKLYFYDPSAGTFTDVTRAATVYAASQTVSWCFTGFGNKLLAHYKSGVAGQMQQIDIAAGGNFAYIASSPSCDIMFTCGPASTQFVMCLNYHDGVTDVPDGWFCSAVNDYTGWTPGTNLCAKGQLINNPGPFVAGAAFRDGAVAFKENAMFIAEFIGAPAIWKWRKVSSDIGCIGKNALIVINDILYFMARDGLYFFDGSYPKKIPGQNHNDWSSTYIAFCASNEGTKPGDPGQRYAHALYYDPKTHVMGFMLSGVNYGATVNNLNYVYWLNLVTGKWSRDLRWFGQTTGNNSIYMPIDDKYVIQAGTYRVANFDFARPGVQANQFGAVTPNVTLMVIPDGRGCPDLFTARGVKYDFESLAQDTNFTSAIVATNVAAFYQGDALSLGLNAQSSASIGFGLAPLTNWTDLNNSGEIATGDAFEITMTITGVTHDYSAELKGLWLDYAPNGKQRGA